MSLWDDAKKFSATAVEWWGDGGHPDPRAQDRADVCSGRLTGNPCPHNYQGGWIMPQKVADTVRRWFELKNHLKLRVEGEEKLGHCEICNCGLSLKIHVPRQTTLNHTPDEEYAKLPEWCWMRTESETTKP